MSDVTVEEILATAPIERVLTANDRCDRCGAQAFTKFCVHLETHEDDPRVEGDLVLCGHHSRVHESALLASGHLLVVDERDFINEKAGASA